ncbi:MAG: DUF4038 domain-containing protein, partial [Lentisphaerae bacterium]|nr:DUF4038 domain-containing protein [Lentisphaerota bacterium]
MQTTHIHGVYEASWESDVAHTNPLWECDTFAEFTGPSGQQLTVRAFWDEGATWRLRFSPNATGTWTWAAQTADRAPVAEGTFACVPYTGDNPLYLHGPLQLAANRRFLEHADGTPFFWLADTAWNGVIRGDDANWHRFLTVRSEQRFTVTQFVCSHWRGDAVDEMGEPSCTEEHPISVNPAFFQRLDRRVAMINGHGLLAAPVALWSLLETDIGYKLPEEDAIRLASYIVARYDAYQVAWLLGGDGNYQKMGVERWKRIGREVFVTGHDRLVTLHPCGINWVGEEFRSEEWYDIIGYQSGHGDGENDLRWLTQGPPATQWQGNPQLPVINLEPNYEAAKGYRHKTVFTDYHVRRAAYWSLLVSPTAGLTYGHDSIWNWNFEIGPSEGHGDWHDRAVPPWHTGLDTPGIHSMTMLRSIIERLPWTRIEPAPEILAEQPGNVDPTAFIAAARAGDELLVIYTPCGGAVRLVDDAPIPHNCRRVDPRTGEETLLEIGPANTFALPVGEDSLLAVVYCGCRKRDLQPSLIQVERSTRRCIALLWHRSTRRCSVQPS